MIPSTFDLFDSRSCYTRINHFPSNGVATDPRQCFFVLLMHLNTDALYFHLQNGNIFVKKIFQTLFLKAKIARSCSLEIALKIVKFTSNDKKKYLSLEDELK